jgi:hypothetical protein
MARAGRLVRGRRKHHHQPSFGVRLLQTSSSSNVKAHHIPTVLHLPACFSCEARSLPIVCMPGRRASRVLPPVPSASVFCAALHARAHRSGIFRPSPVSLASSCPLGGADTQMRRQLCSTVVHIGVDNRNLVLSKGGARREGGASLASGLGCGPSHRNPTTPFRKLLSLFSGLSDLSVNLFGCFYLVSFAPKHVIAHGIYM